jgi:hypothetical protein
MMQPPLASLTNVTATVDDDLMQIFREANAIVRGAIAPLLRLLRIRRKNPAFAHIPARVVRVP